MTFEYIMQRMLSYVDSSLDKREGSIVYTALAPAALEIANLYVDADIMLNQTFAGTAVGGYLDMIMDEFGYQRKPASKAVMRGRFNKDVEIGERFNGDKWNYSVSKAIPNTAHEYELECEVAGAFGSEYVGALIPMNYIEGLKSAEIVGVIIPGQDIETDESLRERFFEGIKNQRSDGNVAQYMKWIGEFPGIGKGKVIPLWNGANTVKVIILDAKNALASTELISRFQKHLDPGAQGLGNGVAPIGAKVTVETAKEKKISVKAAMVLNEGYSSATGAEEAVKALFSEIALTRAQVGYMELGARLQVLPCCKWLKALSLNSGSTDVTLSVDEIPALESLDVEVVS